MSVEKDKEEIRERLIIDRALNEEKLDKVSGGGISLDTWYCPNCNKIVSSGHVCDSAS